MKSRQINVSIENYAKIWSLRRDGENVENDILGRILSEIARKTLITGKPDVQSISLVSTDFGESLGKVRWVDDIVAALKRLGGEAELSKIYSQTHELRKAAGRSLTPEYKATIRRTLEDHSSDSANYRSDDLFKLIDRGVWALR